MVLGGTHKFGVYYLSKNLVIEVNAASATVDSDRFVLVTSLY